MTHPLRILVFQHRAHVTPAYLGRLLDTDPEVTWTLVKLDEGEDVPTLEAFDGLIVLGAPMEVWDVDEFPWLVDEKEAVRSWVRELDRPYLGMCFGHQMLADALGGTCVPQDPPAIGVVESRLTADGRADPIFADLPSSITALQWNVTCVARPPADAVLLATSDFSDHQAMRVGRHAWSWQWHIEIDAGTVPAWGAVESHRRVAEATLGAGAVDRLGADADARMTEMNDTMAQLWANFRAAVGADAAARG